MQLMSKAMFVGLCKKVGTSQQVDLRRETEEISEVIERLLTPKFSDLDFKMTSGSRREGFRFKGSDVDFMEWPDDLRVITDRSQSKYYNTANTTLILSDSSDSPPGFALLELLTPTTKRHVQPSCVRMNDRVYVSSSIYRKLIRSALHNSTEHGPCITYKSNFVDADIACCFASDFWPPSASSWIDRCHSWPHPDVVDDIVRNRCHFVALGHPLSPHEHEEWRISFSQAEYKLVYSMNHSQFLTYGLLKLFLNKVINHQLEEIDKLLCSYHMKTTIFWAIQQNTLIRWSPQNLLGGFWVCFKLILKWVYEGVCPNFFIPKNNLFLTKVRGSAQNRLFLQLYELYEKGLPSLLLNSSLGSYIRSDFRYSPRLSNCPDECINRSEVDYDLDLVRESSKIKVPGNPIKLLHLIEQFVELSLTPYHVGTIQKLTASFFQCKAFQLHNMCTSTNANKQMYMADKMSCHMLKLAAKFGCVSDMLYIAMYYYKTHRYMEAISVIEMTKVKLAQPYLMYDEQVDKEMYNEAVGGQSWSRKIRQAVAEDIELSNVTCYISELIPEQQSAKQNRMDILIIPVFVMLHFLEFLCYRHIDTTLSKAALDELRILMHDDQGQYASNCFRDISWEILGICQQITGNLQAALYSYLNSLAQQEHNRIRTATQRRIQDVQNVAGVH